MAESPAHQFGQMIGDLLEDALRVPLHNVAAEYNLYLDYKHSRPVRSAKYKASWRDYRGNSHDLDYVLEDGGSEQVLGRPRAFIEVAWRRYTKHSRNKAQEIQGAIMPLAETYSDCQPFLGAVLGGIFTEGSLTQLRSHGFYILYCPYPKVVQAFAEVGFDISYGEKTPDAEMQAKVDTFKALSDTERQQIRTALLALHHNELSEFLADLRTTLGRAICAIYILPLHGTLQELSSIENAVVFLESYHESQAVRTFVRYEVIIRYTTGTEISGKFHNKAEALSFLRSSK